MKQKRNSISYAKYGYYFALPFMIAWLIFMAYPILYTIFLGFTNLKGIGNTNIQISKPLFRNFIRLTSNLTFIKSVKNTFIIWIANFIPQLSLALVLAAWFSNESTRIKGRGFFKVVFYMPNIITAASVAILFNALFSYPVSPINSILHSLGFEKFNFIQSATASRSIVAFIQFWQWYGYTMIVLISGILGISPDIFEAAEIDGASGAQKFFQITLPNLRTIMLFTLVTSLIGGLQMFDIPKLFNLGGPDNSTITASVFIYDIAFGGSYLYAAASAASMVMFVIIAVLSAIMFFVMRDKDEVKMYKAEKARLRAYKKEQKALAVKGGSK
ncbi:MAG: sugar ABC transporter permease [Treponema sp.]|jgi:multiple sugar transport system permease protein|nr:sugar ABC transporter permease [Treponema sp.]